VFVSVHNNNIKKGEKKVKLAVLFGVSRARRTKKKESNKIKLLSVLVVINFVSDLGSVEKKEEKESQVLVVFPQ
jgi:hypothetical protein